MTSDDLRKVQEWWIKHEQENDSLRPHFAHTKQTLNLVKNQQGVLECHGRIQGQCPIYLPVHSEFTRKLVQRVHVETLHGGVLWPQCGRRFGYLSLDNSLKPSVPSVGDASDSPRHLSLNQWQGNYPTTELPAVQRSK